MSPKTVAIVVCSTRPGRINPLVALYVLDTIAAYSQDGAAISIELLDLASHKLPLYDEEIIPSQLPSADPTPHYAHAHTRAWSSRVREFDAFIFATSQYNWSIAASLKNALDYLFHEWQGKPAGIITYGHRGGVKAAPHLRQILTGLRMDDVAEPIVSLKTLGGASEKGETRGTWE